MSEPAFNLGRARLGELLVQRGIITSEQLTQALGEQKVSGRFFGEVLVYRGWATEEEVGQALSEQVGLAYVDFKMHPVDREAAGLVSEELCRTHGAIPLFFMGDQLTVAMTNPLDTRVIDLFQAASGKRVRPVFAAPSAIAQAVMQVYRPEAKNSGISGPPSRLEKEEPESTEIPTGGPDASAVDEGDLTSESSQMSTARKRAKNSANDQSE